MWKRIDECKGLCWSSVARVNVIRWSFGTMKKYEKCSSHTPWPKKFHYCIYMLAQTISLSDTVLQRACKLDGPSLQMIVNLWTAPKDVQVRLVIKDDERRKKWKEQFSMIFKVIKSNVSPLVDDVQNHHMDMGCFGNQKWNSLYQNAGSLRKNI